MIPGGLGVQAGGILMSGLWLGLPPEIVLAAALLKRARELLCGVPGLIAWSCLGGPARQAPDSPHQEPGSPVAVTQQPSSPDVIEL